MSGKFRYKLEALKKLRELKLNMAKADLAMAVSKVSSCDQKIADARENVSQLLLDQRQTTDMSHVKLFSYLTSSEQGRIELEMEKRKLLQDEMDRHNTHVTFLRSELKAVEHDEAAKREDFKRLSDKTDAKMSDEINSIMWNIKSRVSR